MTAMENGDIDMVVDYSGQVYISVLGLPLNTDPDEVYDILVDKMKNDYNIAVSAPLGYNNTYYIWCSRSFGKFFIFPLL